MRQNRFGRRLTPAVLLLAGALGAVVALGGCSVGAGPGSYRPPPDPASASPVAHEVPVQPRRPVPAPARPAAPAAAGPCAASTVNQLVLVSIASQHAWYCQGTRAVYDTPVTTGMDTAATRTPVGHFVIQAKDTGVTLHPNGGGAYAVRYWIPFDAPAYGFHDASWQSFPFGGPQYRTAGSHGCVHLPLVAIEYLYRWAQIGASVDISA
ncbi:MAG: murein L,D-transpeptidase [Jatrophihabitans sp.]|nr:MAG: murein L,D-transpeptidase [Jatrophihabitans sp.]